jgi:hypothetical protein
MNHSWDWSDLYAFVTAGDEGERRRILWIEDDTFLCVEDESTEVEAAELDDYVIQRATFTAPSGETHELVLGMDTESDSESDTESPSLSAGASSVFWHAVTTSNCVKLKLEQWSSWFGLCSVTALSHFMMRVHRLSF